MRNKRQRTARRGVQRDIVQYTKARENLQLAGVLETTSVGAVRNEKVQTESGHLASLPGLVMDAVHQKWSTPPEEQGKAVADLLKMLHDEDLDPGRRIAAFNALRHADRDQWERENPELAGKVKGGGVSVTTTQQVITGDQMIRALQEMEKVTGPIMNEAMLQIEQDASAVLPEEIQ